jgi:hypothetical protein
MPRPLFIAGNKRSGTSQLVRVLNLHPEIFVSHESDIAWILFQFHQQQPFRAHPWDSDRGMRATLRRVEPLLRPDAAPCDNFFAAQQALMERGTPWLPPMKKRNLRWVGDKKPMQHTDPDLLAFLHAHFPDARFLHIVRHPFAVVDSSDRFNQTADGDFWLGLSREQKLERWAFHERHMAQLRRDLPGRSHTLRFEDFCQDTEKVLTEVFAFLDVALDAAAMKAAARQTKLPVRTFSPIPCAAETAVIAAGYGYDLRRNDSIASTEGH